MSIKVLIASKGDIPPPKLLGPRSIEFQVVQTEDSFQFLLQEWQPEIVIISLNGFSVELVSQVRRIIQDPFVGVIACGEPLSPEKEKLCFEGGVDHWLPLTHKPWQMECRISSLIKRWELWKPHYRRSGYLKDLSERGDILSFRDIELNSRDCVVRVSGEVISMTPIQFRLLQVFMLYPENLLTRLWIKENVWAHLKISMRSIDAQISKLKKLVPMLENHLVSIYGRGYRLCSNGIDKGKKSDKDLSEDLVGGVHDLDKKTVA